MFEAERFGMQRLPVKLDAALRIVDPVADKRQPGVRGLDTDLVTPSGLQTQAQFRDAPKRRDHFVVSDRLLRLPFYNDLTDYEQASVVAAITSFDMS